MYVFYNRTFIQRLKFVNLKLNEKAFNVVSFMLFHRMRDLQVKREFIMVNLNYIGDLFSPCIFFPLSLYVFQPIASAIDKNTKSIVNISIATVWK